MMNIQGYNRLKGINFMGGRIFVYVGDNKMPPLFDFANTIRAIFDDYGKASEYYIKVIPEDHMGVIQDGRRTVRVIDFFALAQFGREYAPDREWFERELKAFQKTIETIVSELPGKMIITEYKKEDSSDNFIVKELLGQAKKKQDTAFIGTKPQRYIQHGDTKWFNGTDLRANFFKSDFNKFTKALEDVPKEYQVEVEETLFVAEQGLLSLGVDLNAMKYMDNVPKEEENMSEKKTVKGHVFINGVNVISTGDMTWFFARDIAGVAGIQRENGATIAKKLLKSDQYDTFTVKDAKIYNGRFISSEGLLALTDIYINKKADLLAVLNQGEKAIKPAIKHEAIKAEGFAAADSAVDMDKKLDMLTTRQMIIESIHIAEKLRKQIREHKENGISESRSWPTTKNLVDILYRYIDTADEFTVPNYRWKSMLEAARERLD